MSTRCVRNRLVASLPTSCNNVILSSCYTRLSLTTCWQIVECRTITSCWNDLWQVCWDQQPYSKLPKSRWELVLSSSWEQAARTHPVDKLLEQHCYIYTYPTYYVRAIKAPVTRYRDTHRSHIKFYNSGQGELIALKIMII